MPSHVYTGAYSNRKQKRRLGKSPNKSLLEVICSTVPKYSSIIDIGAGTGSYVKALRERGYVIHGIDGTPGVWELSNRTVEEVDIIGDCSGYYGTASWGLFLEVGEHVPKEFEFKMLDQVSQMASDGLIVSWAVPGQRGYQHVNCRTPAYVASVFAFWNWVVNEEATVAARKIADKDNREKIMVLRKVKRYKVPKT